MTEITQTVETPQKPSAGYKRFSKAITENNELVTIILRTHLLCEYYMDQIIMAKIPRGDCLIDDSRMTFSFKIELIKSLNFLDSKRTYLLDSAKGLNKVRNNCSHTLDYSITETDIDKIGKPQGIEYLEQKKKSGDDLKELLILSLINLISRLDSISSLCVDEKTEKVPKNS